MNQYLDPNDPENQLQPMAPTQDVRAQILASLQQRMAPVAAPDTSAIEAQAQKDRDQSSMIRSGVQLGQAFLGKQSDGSNLYSDSLEVGAKEQLAKAMEQKRMAAEADKRREELRNGLSTRFVDSENANAAYDRKSKDDQAKFAEQQKLDREQLAEAKRHNMAMEKRNGEDKVSAQLAQKQAVANDKSQQMLGKDLTPLQETLNALGEVESALGGPLETFSYDKKGNATRDGKAVDLPGVNIPGIGATSFYNQEARNLDDTMSRVFNQTLKVRSGAAVTDNELKRLRGEFSAGKFNTEAEKIKALQDVKRLLKDSFNNTEAKYNKDVVDEYKTRGGQTSGDVVAPSRPGNQDPNAGVKKQYSPSRNQTRFVYPDGRVEVKDGQL